MEKQAMKNFPRSEELIDEAINHEQQQTSFLNKDNNKNNNNNNNNKRCDSTIYNNKNNNNNSVDSDAIESSISSASFSSSSSSSSSDLMEDATSTSSSSSSSSNGPLFQLSDLMNHLPIKRGLSKYYEGKSESFTSLACVESLEDLAKRENPYRKNIKLCRSYFCSPKSKITKKTSFSSYTFVRKNHITSCTRYHPHVQKHF